MKLYEVSFETWENDADDYNTLYFFSTVKEDVDFYIDLAKKFFSANSNRNPVGLGNEAYDDETLEEVVQEVLEEHPNMSQSIKNEWLEAIGQEGEIYQKLCDEILAEPVQYEEYGFCRVLEKVEVNEIIPGTWLNIKGSLGIYQSCENNEVQYRYSVHGRDSNGEIDVFKIEWELAACDFKEFYVESKPDEISLKVVDFFKKQKKLKM